MGSTSREDDAIGRVSVSAPSTDGLFGDRGRPGREERVEAGLFADNLVVQLDGTLMVAAEAELAAEGAERALQRRHLSDLLVGNRALLGHEATVGPTGRAITDLSVIGAAAPCGVCDRPEIRSGGGR